MKKRGNQFKFKLNAVNVIMLVLVAYMGISIIGEVGQTINLKLSINNTKKQNNDLKKETESLNNEVNKLKDEDYIQSYVSGTIFQTEKGTNVYLLPDEKESNNAPE